MSDMDGWFKSSFTNDNCVQVRFQDGVSVRDSKDQSGPVLSFTAGEWTAFLAGVRNGEFDLPNPLPAGSDSAQ